MAYAYRASTSAGNASGGSVTVNKPTGTVDGDLIIVGAYLESDTNTWSSAGSGFTSLATQVNTGLFKLQFWYKWASGEPASWTWTPTSNNWRTIVCASYSGGGGSGDPYDIHGGSQGDAVNPNTNQTAPSVTTTTADDLLVFLYGNFSGNNVTSVTGAASNLRVSFGGLTIADANRASAGATGTTAPNGGPGTEDYAAMHIALLLTPGGIIPVNLSDTGAGAEGAVSISAILSAIETAAGAEGSPSIAGVMALSDSATGAEGTPAILILIDVSDTGAGAEGSPSISAVLTASETGTQSDTLSISANLTASETGTGADALAMAAFMALSESGAFAEGTPSILAVFTSSDTGAGTEGISLAAFLSALSDTGAGAEGSPSLSGVMSLSDTGTQSDTLSIFADLSASETGGSTEDASTGGGGSVNVSDTGAGTEALSIVGFMSISESGAITDALQMAAFMALAEAASGADNLSISATLTASDTASGTDAAALYTTIGVSETGAGTDASGGLASLVIVTDTGAGVDVVVNISGGNEVNTDRTFASVRAVRPVICTRVIPQFSAARVLTLFAGERGQPLHTSARPLPSF